jgi:hypothetical protein
MLLYVRCYNCTRMKCKLIHSCQQPRTSFEDTRCQSLQRISSCEDNLTVSCVIDNLDLLQLRTRLENTFMYYGCRRRVAYTRCFTLTIYGPPLQLRCDFAVPLTVLEGDDEEFDISHISAVRISSLHGRRGKYLLFTTHFRDDNIPHVWHRLNEVYRNTALQDFMETLQWHKFATTHAYVDFMHTFPTRFPESQYMLQ